MKSFPRLILALAAAQLALADASAASKAATEMARAANAFLTSLNAEQRQEAVFPLKSEARFEWHFIPTEMVKFGRKGLPQTKMSPAQRELAMALLKTGMSDPGYRKASQIMSLEGVLRELEKGGRMDRNPVLYFVAVFGEPSAAGTWSWRYEGHHLSQTFTVIEGKAVVATPSFMGSNPAIVREGPLKGLRVLGAEEDLGRQLVTSLDDAQRKQAVFADAAPRDIITAADRSAKVLEPRGIAYGKLKADQQKTLQALVGEYVRRARPDVAKGDLDRIKAAGWNQVSFAWAGGFKAGEGHYYRVQGPGFLLEYANTQNDAYHVHSTWRDLRNDFGGDLLKAHFEREHK